MIPCALKSVCIGFWHDRELRALTNKRFLDRQFQIATFSGCVVG
jgi:hypothetical protein